MREPDETIALQTVALVVYAVARSHRVDPAEVSAEHFVAWLAPYAAQVTRPSRLNAIGAWLPAEQMEADLATMLTAAGHALPEAGPRGSRRTPGPDEPDDPVVDAWWTLVSWYPDVEETAFMHRDRTSGMGSGRPE